MAKQQVAVVAAVVVDVPVRFDVATVVVVVVAHDDDRGGAVRVGQHFADGGLLQLPLKWLLLLFLTRIMMRPRVLMESNGAYHFD